MCYMVFWQRRYLEYVFEFLYLACPCLLKNYLESVVSVNGFKRNSEFQGQMAYFSWCKVNESYIWIAWNDICTVYWFFLMKNIICAVRKFSIQSMEAFDSSNGQYTLPCRNKCHFKHYFLKICSEKRAGVRGINAFKNWCSSTLKDIPWKSVFLHVLP